jgi:mRNA-decapping enzyme 1B
MNKTARKAVNLGVLRRHDPHISDILDSSSYVVVYKFDEDAQTWVRAQSGARPLTALPPP